MPNLKKESNPLKSVKNQSLRKNSKLMMPILKNISYEDAAPLLIKLQFYLTLMIEY